VSTCTIAHLARRALVAVTGTDGKSIFAGRTVTGFTDDEEKAMDMVKVGLSTKM
jgi:hypothetical protein